MRKDELVEEIIINQFINKGKTLADFDWILKLYTPRNILAIYYDKCINDGEILKLEELSQEKKQELKDKALNYMPDSSIKERMQYCKALWTIENIFGLSEPM